MKPSIKVDSRKMRRALRDYSRVMRRKTIPDILNTKTPFVIGKAMRNAPKVARAKIVSELGTSSNPRPLALRIVASRAKREGKRLTRQQVQLKAKAMIRARLASVRYVSLGWLKAMAVWRSVKKPLKSSSLAAKGGFGKKANAFRHETRFVNAAPGAFMAEDALEKAINQEAASTANFARKRLARLSKRYKG